jgi:DNA-binding XRE family transcriptional regulator
MHARRRAERIAILRSRFNAGHTLDMIADELGLQSKTVLDFCRRYGVATLPGLSRRAGNSLGRRLLAARRRRKLTLPKLAIKSSVSQATIEAIEAGCQMPDDRTLHRLSRALTCTIDELLHG